jgi:neutral ceramidase
MNTFARRLGPLFCLGAVIALLIPAAPAAVRAGELRIGKAVVDITPVPGTPMLTPMSSPLIKLSEAAHDPLCVRAIVMECDGKKAAIVACDLTSIPNDMFDSARALIVAETGMDPDAIMISATHTHTAPQIRQRLLKKDIEAEARQKALDYIASLPKKMAEAVIEANSQLEPARGFGGVGFENTISFNRRFVMQDGSVMTNPGKSDPSLHERIIRPAGPIDPDVGVVYFESPGKLSLATLVNFSLHLDSVGGAAPSADFAATLHRDLGAARGPGMMSLFAIGAAGNINHYNLLDAKNPRRVKGHEEAARIGAALSAAVLRTFPTLQPLDCSTVRYGRTVVELDLPREKGAAMAAQHKNAPKFFDGELDVFNEPGRQWFKAEVQVIALGSELAWVGLPGEMFVEFGLSLKSASPYRFTMIHELANRSIGYVPNMRAYPEGGYEGLATRCAFGSGEQLVDAATRLLIEIKNRKPSPGNAAN